MSESQAAPAPPVPALPAGVGLGWRRETAWLIARSAELAFTEIIAEQFPAGGPFPKALLQLRDRGVPIVPHGISLSLGDANGVSAERLDRLAAVAQTLRSPLVSEHIAFVRAGGVEAGHLLPLPRTRETLDILVENLQAASRSLPVPLAVENIASLFEWPEGEMSEATFIAELLRRTDVLLLLDLANLHANCLNHGWDADEFLDAIPLDRVAYVHLAGGVQRGPLYYDTHAHPVSDPQLELLSALAARGAGPPVLLERDGGFDGGSQLQAELASIAERVQVRGGAAVKLPSRPHGSRCDSPTLASSTSEGQPRERLARAQALLVDSLVQGAPAPAGFDPERLEAAADLLRRKRDEKKSGKTPAPPRRSWLRRLWR